MRPTVYKPLLSLLLSVALTAGCRRTEQAGMASGRERFEVEVMNRYTPVKDQGRSTLCWAYAMAATIETEHLTRGDSVHLSVKYAVRGLLKENFIRAYLTHGHDRSTARGLGQTLINVMEREGMVTYDAYRDQTETDINVLGNKMRRMAEMAVNTRMGLKRSTDKAEELLDEALGPAPRRVFMLGAEYTPQEFARSVCAPGEYIGLTSFTHHPFYSSFALEVPDNWERNELYNVPADTLISRMERAVRRGHGVCWEGDTSERGFSFADGTARLDPSVRPSQEARQKAFERFGTTDDHCMAVVGLARDGEGRRYFIMKNSWGTDNPYGGLMYMSFDYALMKTTAVFMTRAAYEGKE